MCCSSLVWLCWEVEGRRRIRRSSWGRGVLCLIVCGWLFFKLFSLRFSKKKKEGEWEGLQLQCLDVKDMSSLRL